MYYFLANIKIHDKDEYQKYACKADEVFSGYKGKYLALDDNPQLIEGKWEYTRTVIIEFKSKADFESWYSSDEYQEILKYRLSAAKCDTILVQGSNF